MDRRIRWYYTTTILRLRIGARLTRYRNCKFHNFDRTISRHADGISRYSVPPSAGPLLPLYTLMHAHIRAHIARMHEAQTQRGPCVSVSESVCLLVTIISCAKTAELIQMSFGWWLGQTEGAMYYVEARIILQGRSNKLGASFGLLQIIRIIRREPKLFSRCRDSSDALCRRYYCSTVFVHRLTQSLINSFICLQKYGIFPGPFLVRSHKIRKLQGIQV